MKLTRREILPLIAISPISCTSIVKNHLPKIIEKQPSIGQLILDAEQEAGLEVPQTCYSSLTEIIENMTSKVSELFLSPVKFLQTIDHALRQQYTFAGKVPLLSTALQEKRFDCDTASFVYLSIAEEIAVPLFGVTAPGHFFVRWYFSEKKYCNWETTQGKILTDAYYEKKFSIPKEAIRQNTYLRSLQREELLGIAWTSIGGYFYRKKDYYKALAASAKAFNILPNQVETIDIHASTITKFGREKEALLLYDKALALNPHHVISYYNKAVTLVSLGEYDRAIALYDMILERFPEDKHIDLVIETRKKALLLRDYKIKNDPGQAVLPTSLP